MAESSHGRPSLLDRERRGSAVDPERRSSRRLSVFKAKEFVGAAIGAVAKIAEARKEVDPEAEPGFTELHPQWEDSLPPIYAKEEYPSDISALEEPSFKLPPVCIVAPKKEGPPLSESTLLARKRWKTAYQSIKKNLVMRNQALQSSVGPGGQLDGFAFGKWDKYSPGRIYLFQTLYNKKTEYTVFVLILLQVLIIMLKASKKGSWKEARISVEQLDILDLTLTVIFSLECIGRIACLGLYKGPHTFLRGSYNKIDLLSVLDSWAHLIARYFFKKDHFCRLLVFRLFRALLTLRDIEFFSNVLAIFEALQRSMEPLEDVMLLALIMLFFYSLIGLQFFGSDLAYRCVRQTDGQMSYPVIYCSHFSDRGLKCPSNLVCKKTGGNPGYGAQSFDMFPLSMLTLFQVVSLEGWSFVMYVMETVEFKYAVAYFITLVVIVGYFLVNIVVAAISGVFLRVRHEHQALLKKNRNTKKFSFYNATVLASILKDVVLEKDKKLTWRERFKIKSEQMRTKVTKAMRTTSSKMRRVMSSASSFGGSFNVSRLDTLAAIDYDWDPEGRTALSRKFSPSMTRTMSRTMSRGLRMGTQAARQTISSKCRAIVKSKIFRYSELFVVTANLLVLCVHHEGMPSKLLYILYALEALFIVAFTAEMVLRFLSVGLVEFMDDQMNVWEIFVIAVSAGSIMTRSYPNISGARIMRWFYVDKKETKKHTSIVADCIKGLGALSAVSFFYLLIIFVFSVIGMELYAGEFYKFQDGYPRDHFDDIFTAMMLWFTCTTADNWVNQMWNAMRSGVSNNWIAPFLFVTYFIITVFLILNLIIAVILEKTELSDSQKKQIQKVEYLKHLRSRQKRLLSSKGSGTWLIGAVEGATAGVKSLSKRLYTKKVKAIPIHSSNAGVGLSASSISSRAATPEIQYRKRAPQSNQPNLEPQPPLLVPGQTIFTPQTSQSISAFQSKRNCNQASRDFQNNALQRSNLDQGLYTGTLSAATTMLPENVTLRSLSTRASQILLGTGFPVAVATQQAPRTALRNSIMALVNKPVVEAATPSPGQPLLQQEPSKKVLLKAESRASFELAEYEELNKSFSMREQQPWYLSNTTLFLFKPENWIRMQCQRIVMSKVFTYWTLVMIGISVAVVISMSHAAGINLVLAHLNLFVFVMFTLEFTMKVIAVGFLLTPDPYLGDVYNFLDLLLLILDALFIYPNWDSHQLQVIRILSSLRPLRLLCRIEGMKVLTTNLLRTIPAVASVLAFTLAIFSVFATVGVQMFKGRYSSCSATVDHNIYCVGNDINDAQILSPRVWSNPGFHFDNFPSALLSLFIVSTFDNVQTSFMYPAMDIHGPEGTQPERNSSPLNALFFVAFICVGGFFILRMFVGVFIDQFGLISGSKLLTERQKLLRDTNRIIQRMKPIYNPEVPRLKFQRWCHMISTHRNYPHVIRCVILVNYSWLSSHFAGQPASLTVHRNRIEASFATFYLLEAIVKLLGHYPRDFFSNPWNVFELCNAIVSETCMMPDTLSLRKTVGRVPMGLRILRVIRYTPRLNTLLRTVIVSMMHMLDIVWLIAILLISFSVMGVQMFENVRDGICIGFDMNFNDFASAFVTLFQVMTGDNWSCILIDARTQFPYCTKNSIHGTDCGNAILATIYFVSFIVLASHIFMNMFVASIIDTITFGLLKEKTIITPSNLTDYQLLWNDTEFDPKSTGFIGLHKLRSFVNKLGIPLGRRHNAPSQWFARIEWEVFNFHIPGKGIPFRELLETLALYKIGSRGLELAVRIERERQIQKIYRYGATIKIQSVIRGFLIRRRKAHGRLVQDRQHETHGEGKSHVKFVDDQPHETSGDEGHSTPPASKISSMLLE